jgi:MFS family permease
MSSVPPSTPDRPPLVPILLAAAMAGMMMGTSLPLVPLALRLDGHPQWLAGAMTAAWASGVLIAGPFLPRLAARLGLVPLFMLGLVVTALVMALFPNVERLPWWFALEVVLGMSTSVPWILSETWINLAATQDNRARVMGLYAMAITAGLAVGPVVATTAGATGSLPFYICAALAVAVGAPVLAAARRAPRFEDEGHAGSVWTMARAAPAILLIALIAGWCESAVMNFLPIYALHRGVEADLAPLWLSVFIAGNFALMLPLGWLADRRGVLPAILLCLIGSVLFAAVLPLAQTPVAGVPVVFLWGGALFGAYALGLTLIGRRFDGQQLAAANSAFVMTYTAATAVSPPVTGAVMDTIGGIGLPLSVIVVAGLTLCGSVGRRAWLHARQ